MSSIGIVFRPDWLKSKEFKLMTLMARMPQVLKSKKTKKKKKRTRDQSEETTMTIPNMSELISDIKALGRGMVRETCCFGPQSEQSPDAAYYEAAWCDASPC